MTAAPFELYTVPAVHLHEAVTMAWTACGAPDLAVPPAHPNHAIIHFIIRSGSTEVHMVPAGPLYTPVTSALRPYATAALALLISDKCAVFCSFHSNASLALVIAVRASHIYIP